MFTLWIIALLTLFFVNAKSDEYTCACSHENFDREMTTGIFKSPMFPRHYCDNLDCIYEVEPKQNFAVGLVVEYFDTETSHDYVEIYQTTIDEIGRRQAVKQHVLTGQTISQRHFYSAIGGGLQVKFVTDASESGFSGFQMSFYRFEKGNRRNLPCPMPLHYATDHSQLLPELSPHFRTDSLCAFLINSTEAVQITVKHLALSLTLKIYETENYNSKRTGEMLESLNGFALLNLPHSITSRTSSLTVIVSFSPTTHTEFQHSYEIEFKSAASVCNCPSSLVQVDFGEEKTFISPGFPLEYCDLENCTTKIIVASQNQPRNISITSVIRAKIESFRLETDVDYLAMIDEKTLIALTDNAKYISHFTFDHSQIFLNFVTDHSVTDIGFNLTLEVYQKPYYCQCPGSPQVLQDEKYYQNYTFEEECRFLDCFWEIRRPNTLLFDSMNNDSAQFRIVMKIMFQFDAPTEFIEVSNGANLERNNEHLRLDTAMISDESAERSIEFDHPEYVSIWYHREGDLGGSSRYIHIEYEWRQRCLCGKSELKAEEDEWQQLTSPDYPAAYCNSLSCEYQISAPEAHRILINVTDFFTEINQDFLMIFDGNSTTQRHLEALSGMELFSNVIHSQGNAMTLLFTSDHSLSMRGFALWYKAEKTSSQPASGEVSENELHKSSFFSFSHMLIFVLFLVIVALLVHVARIQFPSKFNTNTVVRFVRMEQF